MKVSWTTGLSFAPTPELDDHHCGARDPLRCARGDRREVPTQTAGQRRNYRVTRCPQAGVGERELRIV